MAYMTDMNSSPKIYYSEEVNRFLKKFSCKHSLRSLSQLIENLHNLKVLVMGEAIIDDYHFGATIGKSAKEPIIALKYLSEEAYAGGSLAVANHLASFCKEVELFAMIGDQNSHEKFIRENLKKNVQPIFFTKRGSPTIIKRRFLEDGSFRKLLEFYVINDSQLDKDQNAEIVKQLEALLPRYDLVICADFGHGMFNQQVRYFLTRRAKFLAINTQANAANFGYHTISAYKKADYICLDDREVRLECKDRAGELAEVAKKIFKKIRCQQMIITLGPNGSIGYKNQSRITLVRVPSVAIKGTDSVGAGDALFAVTSALLYTKAPLEAVCFIGNAVGALALGWLGNKKSVTKKDLLGYIKTILA